MQSKIAAVSVSVLFMTACDFNLRPVGSGNFMSAIIASASAPGPSTAPQVSNSGPGGVQSPQANAKVTMDQFIGVNAFIDDPVDKLKVAGFIREYHSWNWDEGNIWSGGGNRSYVGYPHNQMKWSPSETGWDFDAFYASLKTAGIGVSPAMQGGVSWLQGGTSFPDQDKPVDEAGASTTDPNSYEKKSHHGFEFAARYGSTVVADSLLTLDASQARKSGLGLVKYFEDWNEQDKNWMGSGAQFSAQEYAAMASADYDGHANTMHQGASTFGIKNADPNMKFVMGGLFQVNLDFIKQMKTWFEANRADKRFAADVLNFHDYAFSSTSDSGPAQSPEEYDWKNKFLAVTNYRNQNLPGKEVWVSEFGYDTNPNSKLRPPAINGFDMEEVQGQWIVRSYLAFAAAGVDRAQMYMFRDVNPGDSTQFSSSGLVGVKGSWAPKKSWYYVYTLRNVLTNMIFIGEQTASDPNVLIYKFKDVESSQGVYVVWAKTKQNYVLPHHSLAVGSATAATKILMTPGSTVGTASSIAIQSGTVDLSVSERPQFIRVNAIQ